MMDPVQILFLVVMTLGFSSMLAFVVLLVVLFCAAMRGDLDSRGSGTTHAHGAGLSSGELARLPCHDFKSAYGEAGGDLCAICLGAFEAGDRCRQLPRCEHSFHAECVDLWLRKSRACPVCRADVVVVDRPPKGEAKAAAASSGVVEMAERSSNAAALEIVVTER